MNDLDKAMGALDFLEAALHRSRREPGVDALFRIRDLPARYRAADLGDLPSRLIEALPAILFSVEVREFNCPAAPVEGDESILGLRLGGYLPGRVLAARVREALIGILKVPVNVEEVLDE